MSHTTEGKELFTPGIWRYDDGHLFTKEPEREYTSIAHIYDIYSNDGRPEHNWQLIAASKDLYYALKELLECDYTSGTHLYCAQIRAKGCDIKSQ